MAQNNIELKNIIFQIINNNSAQSNILKMQFYFSLQVFAAIPQTCILIYVYIMLIVSQISYFSHFHHAYLIFRLRILYIIKLPIQNQRRSPIYLQYRTIMIQTQKQNNLPQRKPMNKEPVRKVYDSVYGFISFPQNIWMFIDTPHFQRLRNIKQLGCLSWVFPGASHSRFQHSLGTGHLAQKYITTLIDRHMKDKTINEHVSQKYSTEQQRNQAIFTVTLAGILHDIGHGPFSHLFDSKVISKLNNKQGKQIDWEHQIASLCIIDSLYEQLKDKFTGDRAWIRNTKNRVKSLIIGKVTKRDYKKKNQVYKYVDNLPQGMIGIFELQLNTRPWQFQLISNRITGIDVDKLDYFRRDAQYLGAKNIYIEHQLLMNQSYVLQEKSSSIPYTQKHRISYPTKYAQKVYDVFYSRYKLYKTYYLSLKANGVDFMIAEILKKAEKYFKLKQACTSLLSEDCTQYLRLTDSIIERIQDAYLNNQKQIKRIKENRSEIKNHQNGKELSKQEKQKVERQISLLQLQKSWEVLQKLRRRQIYSFLKEYHKHFTFQQINKGKLQDIKNKIKSKLQQKYKDHQQIIIHKSQIGFGIKDKNPFQCCKFYDKSVEDSKNIEPSNQRVFSMLKPEKILQLSIRVYIKKRWKNLSEKQKQEVTEQLNTIQNILTSKQIGFTDGQGQKTAKSSKQQIIDNNQASSIRVQLNQANKIQDEELEN